MRFRHLLSLLSFTFVAANLLLCLPLILVLALGRVLFPFKLLKCWSAHGIERVYRWAVRLDAWWFKRVLGINFVVEHGQQVLSDLLPGERPLIICNHQSWFDIFLLQSLISAQGPMLKFVIKTELIWVPVLGWVCLALNFPRLLRTGDSSSRAQDLKTVEAASLKLRDEPGGLLIFPEGTRFTREKRDERASPYRHLLRPKAGGFAVAKNAMPNTAPVLDVTIGYGEGDANCWRCMGGLVEQIRISVREYPIDDVEHPGLWLVSRWSEKDEWLQTAEYKQITG